LLDEFKLHVFSIVPFIYILYRFCSSWHGVIDIDRRTQACQKALLGVVYQRSRWCVQEVICSLRSIWGQQCGCFLLSNLRFLSG
jgi:hypothetical protein